MVSGVTGRRLAFVFVAICACGGDDGGASDAGIVRVRSDAGARECIDEDGDGYVVNCSRRTKRDCDDDDAKVTDLCFRCADPTPGCPCAKGTEPLFCKPPPIPAVGGYLMCPDGTMYCTDGKWGECKAIGEYVFVSN